LTNEFEKWMSDKFDDESLYAVANLSAPVSFPHIFNSPKTTELYEKYKKEIWETLCDDAASCRMNIVKMISNFEGAGGVTGVTQFENLLVWYAAERFAYKTRDDND